jgi:hypothetical protein
MSELPIADQAQAAVARPGDFTPATFPGQQLAIPTPAELEHLLGVRTIPVRSWLAALVDMERFEETNQEEAALSIVKAILTAETSEQVFATMDMLTAEDLIGKDPGARSDVLTITNGFPLASTFEEGASAFAVISAINKAEQREFSFSCGARAVQAAVVAHMIRGWMPFDCVLTRRRKPTRAGFYPLNLERGL